MNEKDLTHYIRVLTEARTNLEFQVISLSRELAELKASKTDNVEAKD